MQWRAGHVVFGVLFCVEGSTATAPQPADQPWNNNGANDHDDDDDDHDDDDHDHHNDHPNTRASGGG